MTVETVPKDILDKLNAGIEITDITGSIEVVNPAGAGLVTLSYGSSDGGTTWHPVQVDANGVANTTCSVTIGGTGAAYIRGLGFTFSVVLGGAGFKSGFPQDFTDDNVATYLQIYEGTTDESYFIVKFLLQEIIEFDSVNASWTGVTGGGAPVYNVKLEKSNDDISYEDVFDVTGSGDQTKTETDFSAKYLKLTGTITNGPGAFGHLRMKILNLFVKV